MAEGMETQGQETGEVQEPVTNGLETGGTGELETPETQEGETRNNGNESGEAEKEEKKGFNPEDIEFEEEESDYTIGEYNLSKFKDDINFQDENVRNTLTQVAGEMKEKGFTQEQIEWILEKEISSAKERNVTQELDQEKVKSELKSKLTLEERRNYKAVTKFTREIIGEDKELSSAFNEIVSNPYIVKLLNKAYMHNIGGKNINGGKTQVEQKKSGISSEIAIEKLQTAMIYGKLNDELIKELRENTLDKENFDVYLKAIGKLK